MSWAEEDWTVGLSGRVLQKVKELQVHQERLSRENKQKQLQLDNIHSSLEKQTAKYEQVRGELQSAQRELQRVQDETKTAVISRERLAQELQTKQAQVCSFEGQLDAARTLNNKLTQEVKRLEAELEKLQNSSRSADTTLFSTPCWSTTSPWEHDGSRKEERSEHKDEGRSRTPEVRQRLQFSEIATASLPRQQPRNTPHRHPSNQSDSFSTPLAVFPWERDDSRRAARRPSPPSPQTPSIDVTSQVQLEQGGRGKEQDHRTETDSSVSALRSRVSALEEELCAKAVTIKSIQNEMVQSKKEISAKELNIQRARDELSLAHARIAKESERASGAEQRLKQLQEELKCQRQNAESSRLQYQQRSKEVEKQHQRDLAELQKERQCLEKQHQQEVNKLNQELQQARTLHNALQAQADKLALQKQVLDKELDALKEKLKWTEGQLQESQKKEAQSQAKLTEAIREAEGAAVSLEQSRKKERALEEEGRRLAEERADALRLLKELQEQKAAPAPLVQSVGQSFSTQPIHSVHSRLSAYTKRSTADREAEQKREEDLNKRRVDTTTSYPSDREPAEGSEHITVSPASECIQRGEHRRSNEVIESDSSGTNKPSSFDNVLSSSHSTVASPTNNTSRDDASYTLMLSDEKTPFLKSEQAKASEDLKRENATLRSELNDVREELQKRLEDLESQRRAEAEARSRLKQLSRKHASQSVEKEEQDKEWRTQLESEKAETERLRRTITVLETEIRRARGEREKNDEEEKEKNNMLEDRESEMIELNVQLKKQLAEVKAQLALEREERMREEEEKNKIIKLDVDLKNELSMKLEELKAELEELKHNRKDSVEEEKLSDANSPLTYLTLHDDVHNSGKLLPSPEQQFLFCQSTNQRNMLVSQATADLIQEAQTVGDSGHSPQEVSDLEDTKQNYLVGFSLLDHSEALSGVQKEEPALSDFAEEVKRLRKKNARETERANQYQVKLEALQSQVTRQTQQLTMAFEKQSQHISGLLAELQEKESVLLSQGEEMQRSKQELDALKAQIEGEERKVREIKDGEEKEKARDKRSVETSGLKPKHEKESVVTSLTTNLPAEMDSNAQKDEPEVVTTESKRPTIISDNEALLSGEQHLVSVDSDKTEISHDSAGVMGKTECNQYGQTADLGAELLALRQENQQLIQRILSLTLSDTSNPALHTDSENQKDPVNQSQNTGNAVLSSLSGPLSPGVLNDLTTEARQSLLQTAESSHDERSDLEREDNTTVMAEEELEAVSELHIKRLQQKMVELHMRVKALSEANRQQAEEIAVWRLASQPAPTFDRTDNQSVTQDPGQGLKTEAEVQKPYLDVQSSPGNVTVIREDELVLSCSSRKLQGSMLFSRLQQSKRTEPKCLHSSENADALQECSQDTDKIDKDSEKENQEINLFRQSNSSQTQQREKTDPEDIQLSSEKISQQHVTKVSHKDSGPEQTKRAECHVGVIVAKPDASSAANEINTTNDSSHRDVSTKMKSVSSQTEESLYPHVAPSPPELHCAYTQTEEEEEEDEEELVKSPPAPLSEGAELGGKVLFSGSFPIPADPARLAERIRRNRTQLSAAFDDTEYEPYGLPEVVMKGFADIPSGPSCPYIVRRGLLGTTVVPVPQKNQGPEQETD